MLNGIKSVNVDLRDEKKLLGSLKKTLLNTVVVILLFLNLQLILFFFLYYKMRPSSCKHISEFLKQSWNSDENSFVKVEKIFNYITNLKKNDNSVKIVLCGSL